MPNRKRAILTAQLPPTPCTPQMRELMLEAADKENASLAEIQRAAFSLFLSRSATKSIVKDTESIREESA